MTSFNREIETLFSHIIDNQLPYENSNNIIENNFITEGYENNSTKKSSYLYIGNNDTVDLGLENVLKDSMANSSIENFSYLLFEKENEKEIDSINNSENNEKKELFMIKKHSNQLTKKKRGRDKKKEQNKKVHDKSSTDNILSKIQNHYLSFIIDFLNNILKYLHYNQKFLKSDYSYRKNINVKHVNQLKMKTLAEIVCFDISSKYKKHQKNENKLICEQIKEKPVLKNILSENYLQFFKKVYYKSQNPINLNEYGLNEEIQLKKVKMYKDLLEKSGALSEDKILKKNMDDCLLKHFLPKSKFLFH